MKVETLGRRIRQLRQERGLSQEQVGRGSYTRSFVSQVENDQIKPSVGSLVFLAESLGVDLGELAGRFLDVEPRARVRVDLLRAMMKGRSHAEAERIARRVLADGIDHPAAPVVTMLLGSALLELGQVDEARRHLSEARIVARDVGDMDLSCEATLHLGRLAALAGKHDLAVDLYTDALETFRRGQLDNQVRLLRLQRNRANNRFKTGDHEGAEEDYRQALSLARDMERFGDQAGALMGLAMCTQKMGRFTEAEDYYRSALILYQALKMQDMVSAVFNNLGLLYEDMDDGARALESFQRSLDIKRQLCLTHREVYTLNEMARHHLKRGHLDKARALALEARAKTDGRVELSEVAATHILMARIALAGGRPDIALKEYEQGLELLKESGSIEAMVATCLEAGAVRQECGDGSGAITTLRLGLEFVQSKVPSSWRENL